MRTYCWQFAAKGPIWVNLSTSVDPATSMRRGSGAGQSPAACWRAGDPCDHSLGRQLEVVGGRAEYAEFRGKPAESFWNDDQVISDFEETIRFTLSRVDTYTGKAYKDDPAILGGRLATNSTLPPTGPVGLRPRSNGSIQITW